MGLFDRIKRAFTGEDESLQTTQSEQTEQKIVLDKYDKGMEKTQRLQRFLRGVPLRAPLVNMRRQAYRLTIIQA